MAQNTLELQRLRTGGFIAMKIFREIDLIPGIKVNHDEYGTGVITSSTNEQGYISVEFDNSGLVELDHTQLDYNIEIQGEHRPGCSKKLSKFKSNPVQGPDTDIAIIEALKAIETRKCKEKNLAKTILKHQNIITRGKIRIEREKIISETVLRLIRIGVISRQRTSTNTWIKLELKHVDYLKKKFKLAEKNKKDGQLTLPLIPKTPKANFMNIHNFEKVQLEQSSPIFENEESYAEPTLPTLVEPCEDPNNTNCKNSEKNQAPQFTISPSGELIENTIEAQANNTIHNSSSHNHGRPTDLQEESTAEQLVKLINKSSNLHALLDLNTIRLDYASNTDSFHFEGKLNPFEQSIVFTTKFDLNKQKIAELLDLTGQHHFSSIIGVTLFRGNDRKLILRKSIPGFYTPRQSLESLLCMVSDIKEVKLILESSHEPI